MHTSKYIQEPLAHCSMNYNLWWTNSNLTCCLGQIVCELGCSMSFQFCVSWHKSHKRGHISCFPQSGRVKWDFTSPYGNDSPCQTLALKTARPSPLTDRDDTSMSMHRPSVHLFRNRACWESYMCTYKHTHLSLGRLDIFLRRAHTHTHTLIWITERAVTDLPMKAAHKPRQTTWTAVKISTSAVQQLHNCKCLLCGRSGWMGHGNKPHVFLMIRLSALAHETAPGTQFLMARLNSAEIPRWLLVLWGRFRYV